MLCLCSVAGCVPNYAKVANIDADGSAIVCFGDSITRGFGASPGKDYPALLSDLLGRPVINAGRDGDTTASGLARLKEDVLTHNPRLVIVSLGGNDFLQRVPSETVMRNLDAIVARCVAEGAMVVLVHAKFGVLLSDPYKEGIEEIADRHNVLVVDNALRGVLGGPSRMHDSIHPNDDGYRLIAERVAAVAGPLLRESDERRGDK